MENNLWFFIGIGLLIWLIYDLVVGITWSYRKIHRKQEPFLYWVFIFIWAIMALGTIYLTY